MVVILGVAVEAGSRVMGVGDFPIYERDAVANYIPASNQQGTFFRRYHWAFNDRHMGVAAAFAPDAKGVLLIEDSIVLGGNQMDQPDKLGPLLARKTGCAIWPLSASSWALANELGLIEANRDFEALGTIVIVSNDGDFGEKSLWQDDFAQPMSHPLLASLYAVRKTMYKPDEFAHPYSDRPDSSQWLDKLIALRSRYAGRILLVGYPDKLDYDGKRFDKYDPTKAVELVGTRGGRSIEYVDVLRSPAWNERLYRDNIHPNVQGNAALAGIVAAKLGSCSSSHHTA